MAIGPNARVMMLGARCGEAGYVADAFLAGGEVLK